MARRPRTLGIYLCKQLAVDPAKGEMSLVGVFHGMTFDRFPSPIQSFTIYAMLYDGEGEGVIDVRIEQMETERAIYRFQKWAKFLGRGMQSHLEVQVARCQFPAPGRFSVEVRFDDSLVDSRVLEIFAK